MKGNMKTLSILVSVLAMAVLMVAIASAAGPAMPYGLHAMPRSIHGEYAITGFSTCNTVGPAIMEGDYTFNVDGTGSAKGFVRSITWANVANDPNIPQVVAPGFVNFSVDFKYDVTRDGRITFTYPPCVGEYGEYASCGNKIVKTDDKENVLMYLLWDLGPSHGVISADGKTITITCGPPAVLTVRESYNALPAGTTRSCVTSAMGIRLH